VSDPEGAAATQLWARHDADPCDNTAQPQFK